MKLNRLLFALFLLFCLSSSAQDSLEVVRLNYQITTQNLLQKSKTVADWELKALLARQALTFAQRYDLTDELWGALHSLTYYGLKGMNRSLYHQNDPRATYQEVQEKADSAFNQYVTDKAGAVKSVHISNNGREMYATDGSGRILLWTIDSRMPTVLYQNNKINRLVAFSKDERWLAVATIDDEIGLFDQSTPKKGIKIIKSHDGAIVDIDFFDDGSGFVTVGVDRQVLQHDFRKSKLITKIEFSANSLDISPDKNTIAIGSQRGDIALIDLTKDENNVFNIYRSKLESKPVEVVRFNHDGKFLGFGGYDRETGLGYLHVWNNEIKEEHGPKLIGFTSGITDISFSEDGQFIAASSRDNTARVWQMDDDGIYSLPVVLDDHSDWVWSVDFHPDNKRIFTASADGLIRVFDLDLSAYEDVFCPLLTRNLTPLEWRAYIGKEEDFPWEATCPDIEE